MVRIAVCDDCPEDLHTLNTLLDAALSGSGSLAEVRLFSHPDGLLAAMERCRFDLYILDIIMPMVDGIEVGRTIRRTDREAQIIYVAGEASYAFQSFDTNPAAYILKPIDARKFLSTLSYALSKAERAQHDVVIVKAAGGLRTLPCSDIAGCEYATHRVRYFLRSGEQVESTYSAISFTASMAPLLKRGMFVKSHESFVVNVSQIMKLTRTAALLKGGVTVPVSRSQYPSVRRAYLAFGGEVG